jgi:predicted regulator of Ras-like GTPase activity (Roadblock/LC7/MglB family)
LFAETLRKVIDNLEGGIGGVIMGLDGIPVEAYMRQTERLDINTIGMEFSFILAQVRKAADSLQVGACEEMAVKADRLLLVVRMLDPRYFIAVALVPEGNFGKARYLMRLAAPRLTEQL